MYIFFFFCVGLLLIIEVEDLWAFWIVVCASIQAHNSSVSGFILVLFFSINSVCVCLLLFNIIIKGGTVLEEWIQLTHTTIN